MSDSHESGQPFPIASVWEESVARAQHDHPIARKIGSAALGVGLFVGPIVAGAEIGLHTPTTVELAPGISVNASLQHSHTSDIYFGAAFSLDNLNMHQRLPVIGDVSARLDVQRIDIDPAKYNFGNLVVLGEPGAVAKPVEKAIRWRAIEGIAVGMVTGIGLLALRRRKRNNKRREQALEIAKQEMVEAVSEEGPLPPMTQAAFDNIREIITKDKLRKRRWVKPVGELAVAAVASVSLVSCVAQMTTFSLPTDKPTAATQPQTLDPFITDAFPLVNGATVSGIGGYLFNSGAHKAAEFKNNADAAWRGDARELRRKATAIRDKGGLSYLNDPNIVSALVLPDVHCNLAYMKSYLPEVVRQFQPDLVIDAGDTYTTTNTLPTERYCMSDLLKAIFDEKDQFGVKKFINVAGNHDPLNLPHDIVHARFKDAEGEWFEPVVDLNKANHYTTTQEDLTFVGGPDPTRSGKHGTVPAGPGDQMRFVAGQGHLIAEAAARVKEKTGLAPIGIGHEKESLYEAMVRGKISTAISGHMHVTQPTDIYTSLDGQTTIQQVIGTASGAGPESNDVLSTDGFTEYAPPQIDAVNSVLLFNKLTGTEVGRIDVVVTPDDKGGKVSINYIDFSAPQTVAVNSSFKITQFMDEYASQAEERPISAPSPSFSSVHNQGLVGSGASVKH